ncbi:MAG: GGDEF domain-containing protein [Acidimicrobiales bacterium]
MARPTGTATIEELSERALTAATPKDRASCLRDIQAALDKASDAVDRGRLLICRARMRHNQYRYRQELEDTVAAMALFEEVDEAGLALDATSRAAAMASRLGELSLAAELATKTLLKVRYVDDDRLSAEVANRLGALCCSLLDYDRGVAQFELALAAAERAEDGYLVCLELYNIANALLMAVRAERTSNPSAPLRPEDRARLERARLVLERLMVEVTSERQLSLSAQLLRAELLADTGHPRGALAVLEDIANAAGDAGIANDAQRAAYAVVESHSHRSLGQSGDAVAAAERAVELAQASGDDYELMLTLEERLAAKQLAGDLAGVAADALEVKRLMWVVHQRQIASLVDQIWVRAALEKEHGESEERAAAAVRLTEEDALTRIGNRRRLEHFLAGTEHKPEMLSLVMADIDHFKLVNDTFGHELGDEVLRSVGEMLATQVRPGQVVARYGGDEFVFAMHGAEPAAVTKFAERVRLRVESHAWDELGIPRGVTISLGVGSGPAAEWRSVLVAADRALYLAKRRGRNRVEVGPLPQTLQGHTSGEGGI